MTTFGWKRKAGANISKSAVSKFEEVTGCHDDVEDEDDGDNQAHWVQVAKHRKLALLEDAQTKSKRLKEEGGILAESERYWEAIKKWDDALQLTPDDESILDMKAQALLILHEVFPAVQAADLAVRFNPRWWASHQTLGRAQLGLGEIELAIISFSKALHLNPAETELWEEDLRWACSLLHEKRTRGSDENPLGAQDQEKEEAENPVGAQDQEDEEAVSLDSSGDRTVSGSL